MPRRPPCVTPAESRLSRDKRERGHALPGYNKKRTQIIRCSASGIFEDAGNCSLAQRVVLASFRVQNLPSRPVGVLAQKNTFDSQPRPNLSATREHRWFAARQHVARPPHHATSCVPYTCRDISGGTRYHPSLKTVWSQRSRVTRMYTQLTAGGDAPLVRRSSP